MLSMNNSSKEMKQPIITIDGPAGSGKSTISKQVAKKLNFLHLNSGLFYRAITYYFLKNNLIQEDRLVIQLSEEVIRNISLEYVDGRIFVYINSQKEDITDFLKTVDIDKNVSLIAGQKIIRDCINQYLVASFIDSDFLIQKGLVAEGRDMAEVFDKADFKIYLDASVKKRALRRYEELSDKNSINLEQIEDLISKRDAKDSNREHGKLSIKEDNIYIDTSDLSIDDVVNKILNIISKCNN